MARSTGRWIPILSLLLAAAIQYPGPVQGGGGLNPASPGLPRTDNVFGVSGIDNNGGSAMCVSCHTMGPVSSRSSHFVHDSGRTTTGADRLSKERLAPWSGSGGLSKYGNFGASVTSVPGVNGEMICESCHNLVTNVAGGNNLLEISTIGAPRPLQPNLLTGTSTTLCEGCHVSASLPGHHPMTGDLTGDGTVLSTTETIFTRGFIDNLTQMPPGSTSGILYPAPNRVTCLSCHANGHTGQLLTGARILLRGWAGAASVAPLPPNSAVLGAATGPTQRQFDKDSTGVVRLVPNWQPLCDACHRVDD